MIENNKLYCPNCNNLIQKINDSTIIINDRLFCRHCKKEYFTVIVRSKEYEMNLVK